MADSNQELNELKIKSDSLPDNWLVTLVNPVTGAVAENMTVARFVELFTNKIPYISINQKGFMPEEFWHYTRYIYIGPPNNIPAKSEYDTGFNKVGLYSVSDLSGRQEYIFINAYLGSNRVGGDQLFSYDSQGSTGLYLSRKTTDGNIFLFNRNDSPTFFGMKLVAM